MTKPDDDGFPLPSRYDAIWTETLSRHIRWISQNRRWPRSHSDDPAEMSASHWLMAQRRADAGGELSLSRRAALDALLPSWGASRRPSWEESAEALRSWVIRNPGWLPRATGATDPEEQLLGAWLDNQRQAYRGKRTSIPTSKSRRQQLDDIAPGWLIPLRGTGFHRIRKRAKTMYTTRAEAEQAVIDAIEAAGSPVKDARREYDIDAIVEETYEYSAELEQFVQVTDTEGFWAAVEKHAKVF